MKKLQKDPVKKSQIGKNNNYPMTKPKKLLTILPVKVDWEEEKPNIAY